MHLRPSHSVWWLPSIPFCLPSSSINIFSQFSPRPSFPSHSHQPPQFSLLLPTLQPHLIHPHSSCRDLREVGARALLARLLCTYLRVSSSRLTITQMTSQCSPTNRDAVLVMPLAVQPPPNDAQIWRLLLSTAHPLPTHPPFYFPLIFLLTPHPQNPAPVPLHAHESIDAPYVCAEEISACFYVVQSAHVPYTVFV